MAIFEIEGGGLLRRVAALIAVDNRMGLVCTQISLVLFGTATYETLGDNSCGSADAVGLMGSGGARSCRVVLRLPKDPVE